MTAVNSVAELTREGDIAVLTIYSPPVNALSANVRQGIRDGVKQAEADAAVKAIVLICGGRTFIAGADISEFGKPFSGVSLPETQDAIENCTKPVVAALHGTALGGGFEVALVCHYRVAVPSAKLGLPEIKLGLIPGAGGTQRLTRAVGKSKAMDMVLTARMMDAAEAERANLVSRVFPADQLLPEVLKIAERIANLSPVAVQFGKQAVNRAFESTLVEGVRHERALFLSLFGTPDQKEGMAAFVEKRKPNFQA